MQKVIHGRMKRQVQRVHHIINLSLVTSLPAHSHRGNHTFGVRIVLSKIASVFFSLAVDVRSLLCGAGVNVGDLTPRRAASASTARPVTPS